MIEDANGDLLRWVKECLMSEVEEWLGQDIPSEGEEDYETWMSKVAEIEALESIEDLIGYFDGDEEAAEEYIAQLSGDEAV